MKKNAPSQVVEFIKKYKSAVGFAALGVFVTGMVIVSGSLRSDFAADLISGGAGKVNYEGFVMPIKKSPDWVALTAAEWKMSYEDLPATKLIDFPTYIPANLSKRNLSNSAEDRMIRNQQVTFSTPYMGSYKLNGLEFDGSHLAVDIKLPKNTPVFAIGNGVVTKSSTQTTGFGHHVVIKHVDVPSFDDAKKLTTYYSSYSHLGEIFVSEGQVVKKGDMIAKSGQTGTATTPHVHFQIDNENAPWHPFWPYTFQEASNAGLDFASAVNAGLGKEKALANTINPLIYIQNNLNAGSVIVDNNAKPSEEIKPNPVDNNQLPPQNPPVENNSGNLPPKVEEVKPLNPELDSVPPVAEVVVPELMGLKFQHDGKFKINEVEKINLISIDANGNSIDKFKMNGELFISLESGSAILAKKFLTEEDFVDGIAPVEIKPQAGFGIKLRARYKSIDVASEFLTVEDETVLEEPKIDEPAMVVSPEIARVAKFLVGKGVLISESPEKLNLTGNLNRAEALKIIYEAMDKELRTRVSLKFNDTDSKAWYARYVSQAVRDRVVQGYADGSFKPAQNVTRAEFLKMLVEAAKLDLNKYDAKVNFSDVNKSDWYAKYTSYAKAEKLVSGMSDYRPNEQILREEAFQMIYNFMLN